MLQIHLKYNIKYTSKYLQSFTGKTCSPLLCYRFVSTTLAAQIPSGNAIANSQGLLHAETGYSYFGARYYDSDLMTGWLSVDPMSDKYPNLSPYAYCAWNPIRLVDPDGNSISEFDENGNYLRTTKDNWWHNTFVGRKGHIVDSDGNVTQSFRFADPENDVEYLKNGDITKLQFVKESEIKSMLSKAGAFDEKNRENKFAYLLKEGKGRGKFDFSGKATDGMGSIYGLDTYKSLYLIDGVAHNAKNFGNFLFGAGGKALGFPLLILKAGAHFNSIFGFEDNGYLPQLDSKDDQFSILCGYKYALKNDYETLKK